MAEVSRPPPPKRPTIIRHQETRTSENEMENVIPRRPDPTHGGGRPPPKPPNRPPSFRSKDTAETKKEEEEKVQLRHNVSKSSRPASTGSKNDGLTKRKLEITIVSARPMSEVGFRGATGQTPPSKTEVKIDSVKPELKLSPPTSLVPVKNSLPPRPSKPDSSPQTRPPPIPVRKDFPQDKTSPPSIRPPVSPTPKPRHIQSSPESPSPKPRSHVPPEESSPELKPRKTMTLPHRPLPPTPKSDNEDVKTDLESPAKPDRSYTWSLDSESEKDPPSSISDKPRRPTIIRPSKYNKSVGTPNDKLSSQSETVSTLQQNDGSPVSIHDSEIQTQVLNKMEHNIHSEINVKSESGFKEEINTNVNHTIETEKKVKPPIAVKPKPAILPKPKLKPQTHVVEEEASKSKSQNDEKLNDITSDKKESASIKPKLESESIKPKIESESIKPRRPTIIRKTVPKQNSEEQKAEEKTVTSQDAIDDIPDYASIQKPLTGKPSISKSSPSEKPPPPVPAKRFAPPTQKSKDDIDMEANVETRLKPVARARPTSMMVTPSSSESTAPSKPPLPSSWPSPGRFRPEKGSIGMTSPSKPPPPSSDPSPGRFRPEKNSPGMLVSEAQEITSNKDNAHRPPPPKRPVKPTPSNSPSDITSPDSSSPHSVQEDHDEINKSKPGRPKTGPVRPSHGPIKSPEEPRDISPTMQKRKEKIKQEEPAPELPQRPGPDHPLYHYMLTVPHGQAIHDYDAKSPEDLSFKANDIILLHKRIDESWLHGEVGQSQGIFPQSFIHILRPFDEEISSHSPPIGSSDSDSSPVISIKEKQDLIGSGPRCVARFDFDGEGPDDLCFEEGDYIRLLERVGSEWLKGELHDKVGIFPLTFVEVIEELPEQSPEERLQESLTPEEDYKVTDHRHSVVEDNIIDGGTFNQDESGRCTMCQAIADFHGDNHDDLSFNEGDVIEIIGQIDENWLRGRLKNKEGIFPASFVIKIEHSSHDEQYEHEENEGKLKTIGQAMYDFDGQSDNELSFKTGDMIKVGTTVEGAEDWQWGELNGQAGIFPAAFVQIMH